MKARNKWRSVWKKKIAGERLTMQATCFQRSKARTNSQARLTRERMLRTLISKVLCHLPRPQARRQVLILSNNLLNLRIPLARRQESPIINLSALDLTLDNRTKVDILIITPQMKRNHLPKRPQGLMLRSMRTGKVLFLKVQLWTKVRYKLSSNHKGTIISRQERIQRKRGR